MRKIRDCVVVGSGMGGLATGALLARAGIRVTVLEAHPTYIGGYAQTLGTGPYRFAAGPRYLWNFGPGQGGRRFLDKCGLTSRVPMVELDREGFDHIYVGDDRPIAVPNGWDRYRELLKDRFPTEAPALDRFFDLCRDVFDLFRFVDEHDLYLHDWRAIVGRYVLHRPTRLTKVLWLLRRSHWTLQRAFKQCGLSLRLQAVLFAHEMVFAMPQEHLSFFGYVAATLHYHQGCYLPAGDMQGLVEALKETIVGSGGAVLTGVRIERVKTAGGRVTAVEASDGRTFSGDIVVGNIDPRTFLGMIDEPGFRLTSRLPAYKHSLSLTSLFLGIGDASVLAPHFGAWNIWYRKSVAPERNNDSRPDDPLGRSYESGPNDLPAMLYLNSPSLITGKPGGGIGGGGIEKHGIEKHGIEKHRATVTAFVPSSYAEFAKLAARSAAEYEQGVARHRDLILDAIEGKFIPNLRAHLAFVEIRTPYDNERILGAPQGNVYGRLMTPAEMKIRVPWRGPFKNLYFVGSQVSFAGIFSVIQNACQVYTAVTGDRV
jgi:all-trans-retinol 13,14-reductase